MKRLFISLVMFLALLVAVPTSATPAYADDSCTLGIFCGQIKHYTPDDGYDADIRITCAWGVGDEHLLAEGENSTKYCKDADGVYVRANEELWCKVIMGGSIYQWRKAFDSQGWHKFNNIWDDGLGCTLRRD